MINDLRPNLPNITSVESLNPTIEPSELTGKCIIFDALARDGEGCCYNDEGQVRRYGARHKRGLFDLFTSSDNERKQAVWRFEMRDEAQPEISLGNILKMNLVELNKAHRLCMPECVH